MIDVTPRPKMKDHFEPENIRRELITESAAIQ